MKLTEFISDRFKDTGADQIQFEVRLNEMGHVTDSGGNLIRFNAQRNDFYLTEPVLIDPKIEREIKKEIKTFPSGRGKK